MPPTWAYLGPFLARFRPFFPAIFGFYVVPDGPGSTPDQYKKKKFYDFLYFFFEQIFFSGLTGIWASSDDPQDHFWKRRLFIIFGFLVITHHYLNPVLFSCGPCDSAYLTLYMNIFSPQVFEIFR